MAIKIDDNVPLPDDGWVTSPQGNSAKMMPSTLKPAVVAKAPKRPSEPPPKPQPLPEGTVECYFVGGPLNGIRGPVKGNAKTVEIEMYGRNGEVTSVELYALGDSNPTPTFRYHVGSKWK